MPEAGRTTTRSDKRRVVLCMLAGVLLLTAGAGWAAAPHDPWRLREVRVDGILPDDAFGQCENCHTLDTNEGEPLTGYINRNARTLPQMRAFGGVPVMFGCTFCHSDVTTNVYMKNGLKDYEYTAPGLKHPVGVTIKPGSVNNSNEYFSTFNSTSQVDQLQCIECHDPALLFPGTYPSHDGRVTDIVDWRGGWDKSVNPYALRNVAALGEERNKHCVNTCHGAAVPDTDTTPRMGHVGWGGYREVPPGSGIFKMFEPRGTEIRQSDCGVCHEAHNSTEPALISDGQHRTTTAVNVPPALPDVVTAAKAKIIDTNCTAVCHEGGSPTSNFETLGHGKPKERESTRTMNYNCAGCHDSGVPHRDPVNPKRFGITTDDTGDAGVPHNGSSNQLDDDYDGSVDESDEAAWVNPATSICKGCHSEYSAHSGGLNEPATHLGIASCLDCHDPHGNDVGTNIEMIRTTIAGEPTVFQFTTDNGTLGNYDFYRVGATVDDGVCDNTACHGGRDLETILADPAIPDHTGITKGSNCTGCHTHTSPTTSPSFFPRCDTCHGNPPATGGLQDYQQGIGVHERHVTDLAIPCNECHFRTVPQNGNAHNESNWEQNPGYSVPRGNVDVVFNTHEGTVNIGASYSGYNSGTGTMDTGTPGAVFTCINITCHNPDTGRAGVGLTGKVGTTILPDAAPAWADSFAPVTACTGCHVESPATNPDGGSHYKHDNSASAKGYNSVNGTGFPCQICHADYYDSADNFNIAGRRHANGTLDTTGVVVFTGTLNGEAVDGDWDEGARTCANAYCHGDTLPSPDVPTPVWGSNDTLPGGRCGDCHDTDATSDTNAPTDTIATGNHTAHLTAVYGPNTPCASCHPAYALNGANHVNGRKDFINLDNTTVETLDLTDTCSNCHGNGTGLAKDPTNWGNVPAYKLPCLECHDGSANSARDGSGVTAQNEETNWATTGHGRPATAGNYNQTLHGQPGRGYACTVCHDETTAHINGTLGTDDRFRSVADDGFPYTSKVSEVCLDCHLPGQSASPGAVNHLNQDAFAEASIHSGAMTGSYNTALKAPVAFPAYGNVADYPNSPGYQCEACHDPHGTSKLAMVRPILNGRLGDPAEDAPVAVGGLFDYGTGTLAGLDPLVGANDGVCDTCHRISGPDTNVHPNSAKINNHNQGQVCVTCHDHKKSFYAGCADCHGGGQTGLTRKNYWPDSTTVKIENTAGAHADHIKDLAARVYGFTTVTQLLDDPGSDALQKRLCTYCHDTNPGTDGDHGYVASLPADVGYHFNGSVYLGRMWDSADPPAQTDLITYTGATKTCAAVECHYNTTTPGWESGTPATCTTCHNNGTNDGALINSWPEIGTAGVGDHNAHYAALGADLTAVYVPTNTLCVPCHSMQQPAVDFADIASMTTHINGSRYGDTSIPATFNDKSGGVAAYTPGVTPNENNGTCANVSCHGGSSIGTTPPWRAEGPLEPITTTTVVTLECQKCHQRVDGNTNPLGTEYNDARSGAHIDHDFGCNACHSAAPTNHYAGITTVALDNPDGIGSVTYSVDYTDTTTAAVNALTNGYFNDATTALGVSGTCVTVTCHYNASPAWSYTVATCGTCHLDTPTTNAHPAHVYGTPGTLDRTDCDQCHPSAGVPPYAVAATGTDPSFTGAGLHANGTINLVAVIGALGTGGTLTCTTNLCHARETATTTWNNTTSPLSCNSCHYYAAAPTMAGNDAVANGKLGGTHNAHFFGAPTNIVCADCHVNPTGDTAAKRAHMHNNGSNDGAVLLNKAQASQDEADVLPAVMTAAGDPDQPPIGVDPSSNPTCNAALCHNPSPGASYSAIWTGAAIVSCGACHADFAGDPATGSHTKHIAYAAGYAPCTQCHVDNGATFTHMNRSVDMAVVTYDGAVIPPYDNLSWGSCSAGACHDTDQDPAWGAAVPANDCYRCHINNTAVPDSSTDLPNFAGSDRVASQIGIGAEWSVRGHGAKPPANTCAGCHDGVGVGHQPDLATSGNPFRLAGYASPNDNPDAFCSNTTTCHTGATVPGSNLAISHTYELMNSGLRQRTWPSWRPKCVDCHDPHGDANNLSMVATDSFDRGSSTHGVPTATLNAIPRTTDVIDFTVQGGIGVGSYADSALPASGICQECHLANDGVATALVSFRDDNTTPLTGNHPTAALGPCTQCHKHDKAFEPAGCNGCHGNTVTKQYWPDGLGGSPAYADDSVGAHDNHIEVISQRLYGQTIALLLVDPAADARQKTICAFCHPDPGGNGHNLNNGAGNDASTVDVWYDGQNNGGGAGNNFKAFKVGAGAWGDDAGTAQATYDNVAKTCNNVDCHNEYVTPAGWNTPPDWSALTPDLRCSNFSCHTTGSYPTGSYTIGHTPHAADKSAGTPGNGYVCTECHLDNGTNYRHENGQVDMSFSVATSVDRQFGAASTGYYDKDNTQSGGNTPGSPTAGDTGFAYKNGTYDRTCYNLYCHGADSTWGGVDTSPIWNAPATGSCYGTSTCHNAYGSPYDGIGGGRSGITTGSHQKHMVQWTSAAGVEAANPVGPRLTPHPASLAASTQHGCNACHPISQGSCTACHSVAGLFATLPTQTHADGSIDFTGAITGPSPLTVESVSLTNTNACDECHGGAVPAVTAKANWAAGTALACESCHGDNAAARSRRFIGWPEPASVDAPLRAGAVFDTSGHGKVTANPTYGGKTCVSCHDEVSQHFTQRTYDGLTIPPVLGDTNRLDVINGNDYAVAPNGYCGVCHSTPESAHYLNTKTPGPATSDDGNQCAICHDPHGQSAQDAMVGGTIASHAVSGFTDRDARESYFNAGNTGVCQVCHDAAEVSYYNRTSGATDTHNPGPVCTACHKHNDTVAFQFNCAGCHGDIAGRTRDYPPEGPTLARSPGGLNWTETAGAPDTVGDHQAHTTYGMGACTNCHTATPGVGPTHIDNSTDATMTQVAGWGSWNPGAAPGSTSVVDDFCTITCHNSIFPGVYSAANPTYVRYWNSNYDCYSCHAFDGAADSTIRPGNQTTVTSDWMASGSHDVHINRSTGYAITCANCHTDNTGNNAHKNGSVSFTTNFGATRIAGLTGGNYDDTGTAPFVTVTPVPSAATSALYCGNVYCHSTGDPRGGTGVTYRAATQWANATTADCGNCHAVDGVAGTTLGTNVHAKHTGLAALGQYTIACATCHATVVNVARAIVSTSLHVNGTNDVAFAASEGSYAAAAGGVAPPAGGACTVTYCHSQGLDWTGPYASVNNAASITADWDSATGSLACYGCHGNGTTQAYPSYANNTSIDAGNGPQSKKNSHVAHDAYTCDCCHSGTTSGPALTITSTTLHTNKTWDLLAGGGWSFTPTPQGNITGNAYTPTTCNSIACHAGMNATWGTPLSCDGCHLKAYDFNDYVYQGGVGAFSVIKNVGEWNTTGHGRRSGSFDSGRAAIPFYSASRTLDAEGCAYCHALLGTPENPKVGHAIGTNPFRLVNMNALGLGTTTADNGYGWNDVCLVCHSGLDTDGYDPDGGTTGYNAINGTDVNVSHYGTKHTSGSQGGTFCWDCHDPHGDAGDYMVHSGAGALRGDGVTRVSDGMYGIPGSAANDSRPVLDLDVVSGGYTSADLIAAGSPYNGLCQTCHTATTAFTSSAAPPTSAAHNNYSNDLCTNCHKHEQKFAAKCTDCHGGALVAEGNANWWPDGEGATARWPNRIGGGGIFNGDEPGAHNTHITRISVVNFGPSPTTAQKNTTCNFCHPGGSHYGDQAAAPADLHNPAVTSTYFNDIGGDVDSDGAVTAQTAGNFGVWGDSNDTVTCANINCHYNRSGANAMDPTEWYTDGTNSSCSYCHPGNTVAGYTFLGAGGLPNAHDRHVRSTTAPVSPGQGIECARCHVYPGTNQGHENDTVNLNSPIVWPVPDSDGDQAIVRGSATDPKYGGTAAAQFPTCSNVYCHGDYAGGNAAAANWFNTDAQVGAGLGDGRCGICHAVDGVAGTMTSNVHPKHTGLVALGRYALSCTTCHNTVVDGAPAITNRALHVNGTSDAAFAVGEGAYDTVTNTCSETYCHSQGLDWTPAYTMAAANAPMIPPDWDSGAGSLACYGCHGNGATIAYPVYANDLPVDPGAGLQSKKNSHDEHQAFTCNLCHNATTTDGSTITTPANHANKAWDLLAGGTVTFTVSVPGTMNAAPGNIYTPTTCAAISCHNGGTAQWGATLGCTDCHFSTADVDNWVITDGTPAAISSTEWTTAGHGRTTAFPGGNPAANFGAVVPATDTGGCAYCHDPLVQHEVGTNPFRLANKSGALEDQGWNNVCLVCHKTLDSGYNPGAGYGSIDGALDVDENHYNSPKHTAPSMGGTFCWDCHDPHGDASHKMIQATATAVSDGLYGAPSSTRPVTPLDVVGGGYTSADLVNGGYTGLCQTCHAAAGGANWYNQNLNTPLASHNGADGTLCTECHPHGQDFAPRTCESCHNASTPYVKGSATAPNVMGNGSNAIGGGGTPKPYNDGSYGYNVNGHGRDDNPNAPGNAINVACTACHDLSQANGTHINGVINGRLPPSDTRSANSFFLLSAFVKASPTSDYDVQVTFDNVCATLCHGAGINMRHAKDAVPAANAVEFGTHASDTAPQNVPPPLMFYDRNLKSAATFNGYDGGTNFALCVSCHDPHGTVVVGPRTDLNNKMVIYEWSNPSKLCAQCHL